MTDREDRAMKTIYESILRAVIRNIDVINPPRKMTLKLKRAIRQKIKQGYIVPLVVDGRRVYRITNEARSATRMLVACAETGAAGLYDDDNEQPLALNPGVRRIINRLLKEVAA